VASDAAVTCAVTSRACCKDRRARILKHLAKHRSCQVSQQRSSIQHQSVATTGTNSGSVMYRPNGEINSVLDSQASSRHFLWSNENVIKLQPSLKRQIRNADANVKHTGNTHTLCTFPEFEREGRRWFHSTKIRRDFARNAAKG
jgi:hypothetical protein